jgi:rhodanese-related sulfurtransferase
MRTYKIIFALLLAISCAATGQRADSLRYINLSPSEFQRLFEAETNGFFADIREGFEYKKSRIKGFINMPSSGNLSVVMEIIDKNRPVFLYCTSNARGRRVATRFIDNGFERVYCLDGGIRAWKDEGFPIDKKRIRKRDRQNI